MKPGDFRFSGIASLAVFGMFLGYWLDASGFPLLGKMAFVIAFPVLLFSLARHFAIMKRRFQDEHRDD